MALGSCLALALPRPPTFQPDEELYCRYTKMGYAGNCEPQYILPTLVAAKATVSFWVPLCVRPRNTHGQGIYLRWVVQSGTVQSGKDDGLDDIDFYIGNEAHAHSSTHTVPVNSALVWTSF